MLSSNGDAQLWLFMHINKLLEQKERISKKKEQLEKRGKMLREKERKLQTKRLIESGELILKAEISHIPYATLLGALLEIREKAKDECALRSWEAKGKAMLMNDLKENTQPLILSFDKDLTEEAKTSLKTLRFRWNAFRKEWYGFGKMDEIKSLFKDFGIKIELASINHA